MHFSWDWLGPASSIATVIALIVTVLYYLYLPPFNLKKPEELKAEHDNGRVKLVWKAVHRASNYGIYRDNTKTGVMDILSCSHHHHIDITITAGEDYKYYVVAEDQGRQSPQSDVVFVKTVGTPLKFDPVTVDPDVQWTLDDMRRVLVELRQKDNKTVLAILDMAASQPDTRVAFSDVCQRAGVTGRQGGTAIGNFTRFIRRELGKTRWPFTYNASSGGPYYQLSKEMAEQWQQVESEVKM